MNIWLRDTRKETSRIPTYKKIAKDYIILKQETKIKLLERQLDVLKNRLNRKEGVNSSVNLNGEDIFKLINKTFFYNCFKNIVAHFCKLLDVSLSGHYNYLNKIDN